MPRCGTQFVAVFRKFIIFVAIVSVYLVQDHSKIGTILFHILPFFDNVTAIEECNHSYSIAFRRNVHGLYKIFRSLRGCRLF